MDIHRKMISGIHLSRKTLYKLIPVLFFLCLSIAIFLGIILSPGTVGLSHDWAYGPFSEMIEKVGREGLNLFSESQGNKIYPTDWPFCLMLIPFAGLGGEVLTKGMLVLFTALAGTTMFWLARELKLNPLWAMVAGIVYVFTPIVFTRSMAGHMYYLFAYAIAPLAFMFFLMAIRSRKPWRFAMLSGLVIGLSAVQIQFVIMLPLILAIYLLVDYKHARINVPIFSIAVLIAFLIQLPWVLPLAIDSSSASGLPLSSYINYHEITNAPNLLESFGILGYKNLPYSYTSLADAGIIPVFLLFLSVSFMGVALLALVFRRDSLTVSLSLTALLGVFLAKGTNEPGGEIFAFLFTHTPLIIFRELWHIVFLVVFPATILVAICLQNLSVSIEKRPRRRHKWDHKVIPLTVALLVIISAGYPLMLGGNFGGFLQTYTFSDDYEALFDKLSEENGTTRILWIPGIDPLQYSTLGLQGVDPMISASPLPTYPSSPSSYLSPLTRANMFFIAVMQDGSTTQFGNILSPFGTTEIVVRNDYSTKYPQYSVLKDYPEQAAKWNSQVFASFMQAQDDLIAVMVTADFTEYQSRVPSSMVSAPSTIILGSPDLAALSHLATVTYLGNVAYLADKESLDYATLIFAQDDTRDIVSLIAGTTIDPASAVPALDDQSNPYNSWIPAKGWFWYDPYFSTSMNTGIFTLGDSTASMPISGDDAEVWAKVMFWEDGGTIKFDAGSTSTTIQTDSDKHMAQWVKVGEIDGQADMAITSSSGRCYVDDILVVSKSEIASLNATIGDTPVAYLLTADGYDMPDVSDSSGAVEVASGTTLSRWVDIYKEGIYSFSLDVEGQVQMSIDGEIVNLNPEGSWDHGTIYLREGRYQLNVTAQADSTMGDLWVCSDGRSPEAALTTSGGAVIEHYQKNNAQSWQITVNASSPFFLMLSEPYDPNYIAVVNGQEIDPVQAYSFINGYWINQTGELTIELVYKPQKYFEAGLVIACLTIGFCLAFAAIDVWLDRRRRSGGSDDPAAHKY